MPRTPRVTTRELRTIRQDPDVLAATERYRRAARDWAGRIAVLEVQRDRDLGRLEREIEAAEVEALSRVRSRGDLADVPGEEGAPVEPTEPVEPEESRRRQGWRRGR